jgi:hypothetical protein
VNLVAVGVVASFFVGIAFVLSRIYSRGLDSGKVPQEWSEEGGVKSQLFQGVNSMADGRWKSNLKRIWLAFLILDFIAIIIVLVA